ncbi:hypothetical protein L195_g051842 [Trifolium pratense]|uniref:Uncharacterized protein n=1 Tax=Trifolium pratense TaxID=57577 RepID=A0A2K3K1X6_TRIPR|nr:hypothetical protein L195_g051842 [Trifolium pratense]
MMFCLAELCISLLALVIFVVECCGLDRILKHQGWVQSLQSLAFTGALVASHKAKFGLARV